MTTSFLFPFIRLICFGLSLACFAANAIISEPSKQLLAIGWMFQFIGWALFPVEWVVR